MYERSGDHSLAAEAAEEALAWGRAGFLAKNAGWSQEKVTEMGKGLASKLESGNRGCEAATIFREWLDDREEAVRLMARHDRSAMPVVDGLGLLIGIVTYDDIADVAEIEATEDIHKLGGLEALLAQRQLGVVVI